ncbi:MAG: phosphate/phosphite/phosphonate ABC transporter substrate-binding protein [Candidatus Nitrosopumilus sp. MTA1]|jgi:phosphonate transport system substrate-binding protein|uniref:Phosphate/phosphite/phosphonate ABC transporter substrate-binding protein n=1 Tax=Marine Group I thaumarchaeote TaxID=2511932 RepID=A0A7K4P6Q8_9ARCH|nr:MAG: phosphate/phosphite/phosphonate ABC transporter substrate-binding protein [Nitrosopumilus sp. YT1]NMI82853.1 phosphate/phosphite/phosphonate ABC transporter substrate-binding protein [Candidatus Nitrosopumilus sp. MTA1]NWJ28851.1 phosphate/phosphite/phosphonate ABC transporter substrate-binding protein [Marine Group I thaumarchaeote]NWJ57420.1 phosphate/phosphite/phosphonate ABC transporter substrate-binding protein [Marine Group I thaumarchaeote]NWJ83779.1 phosphate/phosphite/phosphona
MKQQIILVSVIVIAAFLGGYLLANLDDNSSSVLTDETISVLPESKTLDVDTITIGFIPVEKADELTPKAQALEEFLENKIGVDIEIVVPTSYETIIEGMRFGHIDAAFMDTGPAWITHQRTGAEVVLAELVSGKVNYQATVWTLANNDSINSLEDTVGKRVAFTSITGSSGFVRPMGTLVTEGYINIEGDDIVALESALANNFESYTFTGGYKASLQLLLNGNVDVAFGSDIAPEKYLELEDQAKLRSVTTIGPVPSHVFMVNADMSESTRNALVDALIELNYDENNLILQNLYGAEALVPTTTTMHIGDFGTYIDALTGLDQLILDKYDKSK